MCLENAGRKQKILGGCYGLKNSVSQQHDMADEKINFNLGFLNGGTGFRIKVIELL